MAASELYTTPLISDANIQGYWRLEANFNDSGPNGYNLTPSGSPSYSSGEFGNGVNLISAASYGLIADASCANLEISGSQTWGAWIKPAGAPITQAAILAKCNVGGTKYILFLYTASQNCAFYVTGLTTNTNVASSNTISNDVWSFVVGRYDATGQTLSIYLNGTKTSVTASGSHDDTNSSFGLGIQSDFATPYYFDGMVDDAFVFNRALTDTEISQLYTGWPSNNFLAFL